MKQLKNACLHLAFYFAIFPKENLYKFILFVLCFSLIVGKQLVLLRWTLARLQGSIISLSSGLSDGIHLNAPEVIIHKEYIISLL